MRPACRPSKTQASTEAERLRHTDASTSVDRHARRCGRRCNRSTACPPPSRRPSTPLSMTIAVSTATPFSVFDAIPDNLKIGTGGATGIGGGATARRLHRHAAGDRGSTARPRAIDERISSAARQRRFRQSLAQSFRVRHRRDRLADRVAIELRGDCAGAGRCVSDAPSQPAASAAETISPTDRVVRVTAITSVGLQDTQSGPRKSPLASGRSPQYPVV